MIDIKSVLLFGIVVLLLFAIIAEFTSKSLKRYICGVAIEKYEDGDEASDQITATEDGDEASDQITATENGDEASDQITAAENGDGDYEDGDDSYESGALWHLLPVSQVICRLGYWRDFKFGQVFFHRGIRAAVA